MAIGECVVTLLWREQLSVGNDAIDADHKHLIEIINKVEHCLTMKNRSELAVALGSLSRYSSVHFIREIAIAKAVGYTQVTDLEHSHTSLLEQLGEMRHEFDASGPVWSVEAADNFVKFLRDWLIGHVIKEDLLMKPALQKRSPAFTVG